MTAGVNDMGFDPEILGPDLGSEEQKIRSLRQRLLATARRAARQVPFVEDVIAGYYCAMDPATPVKVRATVLAALAYFVLPFDMVPDFIVGIGFGDDATILLGALAMVGTHMRPEHREAAKAALKDKQTL
ncbi:YkvA family protein [Pannonibacter sp.]|uniref:YkvA family protein n=1 Tax=Pannonibacter sp. TaxID=1906786 RepID=UPI003931BD8B